MNPFLLRRRQLLQGATVLTIGLAAGPLHGEERKDLPGLEGRLAG